MKIGDLFKIENARSKGFEAHKTGSVPFVTNGFFNNGIVGFVTPFAKERVFESPSICVSAFCEATVQQPPFLPRGNGGSGLIVVVPKSPMSIEELFFYAAQINAQSWRFSFGRMVIEDRITHLDVGSFKKKVVNWKVEDLLPQELGRQECHVNEIKEIKITELCTVERKYAPYMNQIDTRRGATPYVTTTETDNGISVYCNEVANFEANSVTVSLDGICGTAFYQFDNFVSGEKTAVLKLKRGNDPDVLFYIAAVLRTVSWRFNYGIKLSMARLETLSLPFPITSTGDIDVKTIKCMISNAYGYSTFKKYVPEVGRLGFEPFLH